MSILASMKQFFQTADEGYLYDEVPAAGRADHQPREGRVVSMESPPKSERLTIYTPTAFEDVQYPAADIKAGVTVIVNFHRMKAQDAERVSFFLQGVVMALNGEFTNIAEQTMVFAPHHVGIEQRHDGKRQRTGTLFGGHSEGAPAYAGR